MSKPSQIVDRTAQFGEDSIIKLMIRYSLPSIVAMLVQSTYNMINMSFIGRSVGPMGIAAIAVCNPVTMIQGAINQMIGNGCSTSVAIKLGQGDNEGGRALVGTAVAFNLIVSTTNVILGHFFMEPLLRTFGASEAIMPLAKEYLYITLFGMVFATFMPLNPMMRLEGYPKRAMMTMLLSTFVNLVCSPTFIFVFKLGIRGAALGTFCAQCVVSMWMLFFLTGKERVVGLKLKYIRIRFDNLKLIMQLGLPQFLMSVTQTMLSVSLNKGLGTYGGDIAISSWGVTNTINSIIGQPILGLNNAVQPIIGYNTGAKNYSRVKQALFCSLGLATAISAFGWLITRLFPAQIFSFFSTDPELIAMGTRMMIVFRALIFVTGFQQAGSAYFQYVGKPKTAVVLSLSRQVLILMPLIWILPRFLQLNGILYSGPIADVSSTTLTSIFIFLEVKRLNALIRSEGEAPL